eukprot:85426_1
MSVLVLPLILLSQCISIATSAELSLAEKRDILDLHNRLRDQVASGVLPEHPAPHPGARDMNALVWDKGLEIVARTYAESCPPFAHNPNLHEQILVQRDASQTKWGTPRGPTNECGVDFHPCIKIGENVAQLTSTRGLTDTAWLTTMVNAWWDEYKNWHYGPSKLGCDGPTPPGCGHYTQMVWAETRYIGCGYTNRCDGQHRGFFVCNYFPPGNVNGATTRPYKKIDSSEVGGHIHGQCMADRAPGGDPRLMPAYPALCGGGMCSRMCDGDSVQCNGIRNRECLPLAEHRDCYDGLEREICGATRVSDPPKPDEPIVSEREGKSAWALEFEQKERERAEEKRLEKAKRRKGTHSSASGGSFLEPAAPLTAKEVEKGKRRKGTHSSASGGSFLEPAAPLTAKEVEKGKRRKGTHSSASGGLSLKQAEPLSVSRSSPAGGRKSRFAFPEDPDPDMQMSAGTKYHAKTRKKETKAHGHGRKSRGAATGSAGTSGEPRFKPKRKSRGKPGAAHEELPNNYEADHEFNAFNPLISGEYHRLSTFGSPLLIGGVGGASAVVIIMFIFCLGLVFGMIIYWAYTQKRALDRAEEEKDRFV